EYLLYSNIDGTRPNQNVALRYWDAPIRLVLTGAVVGPKYDKDDFAEFRIAVRKNSEHFNDSGMILDLDIQLTGQPPEIRPRMTKPANLPLILLPLQGSYNIEGKLENTSGLRVSGLNVSVVGRAVPAKEVLQVLGLVLLAIGILVSTISFLDMRETRPRYLKQLMPNWFSSHRNKNAHPKTRKWGRDGAE
ncbi:MAG: hypothetical protein AAF940_13410, partial [Pseudomonadota bacterium]